MNAQQIAKEAVRERGAIQKEAELARLLEVFAGVGPKVIVEIGCDAGGTLWAWGQLGADAVIGITLRGAGYSSGQPLQSHGAEIIEGDSHDETTLERLRATLAGRPIDVLLIDGDHSFAGVTKDWEMYAPLVRPGGIVALHDICHHPRRPDVCVSHFWALLEGVRKDEFISDSRDWGGVGWVTVGARPRSPAEDGGELIVLCAASRPSGAVSVWWSRQIAEMMWPLSIGKKVLFIRDSVGNEVAETRNKIVTTALALDRPGLRVHSLFWVDDDVLISRAALVRLYEHHADIAAGVYFLRGEPGQPLIFPRRGHGTAQFEPNRILMNMWGAGMGLTLIRADVYKDMLPSVGKDKYGNPEWYKTVRQYTVEGNMLNCGGTEDLYFFDAAWRLGYRPIVDCGKWTFGWHFDLATQRGYPEKQFAQWSAQKPVTWEMSDGRVVTWE